MVRLWMLMLGPPVGDKHLMQENLPSGAADGKAREGPSR